MNNMTASTAPHSFFSEPDHPTAILALEDGTCFYGQGFGAETTNVGEVCFNTSMTGYQEIMTDPSYAGQIITFTFPHIGNTGTNSADIETDKPASLGMIVRNPVTAPSNWRSDAPLDAWLKTHNLPGIAGIDTRALTRAIRDGGAPKGVICHDISGTFDEEKLVKMAKEWPGLKGMDLAAQVTTTHTRNWQSASYNLDSCSATEQTGTFNVIAMDFGCKQNILRCLVDAGCNVELVPADTSAKDILARNPDGIFLANGPGDPAATAEYVVPELRKLIDANIPIFGICIGHQLLALAFGGTTEKMEKGHRGANHPVRDLITNKIEITSQNHGFMVTVSSLPDEVEITHISLFDGSVEGLRHKLKPVFSVQYHPESSPGPHDSRHLFTQFTDMIAARKS